MVSEGLHIVSEGANVVDEDVLTALLLVAIDRRCENEAKDDEEQPIERDAEENSCHRYHRQVLEVDWDLAIDACCACPQTQIPLALSAIAE